MTSEKVSLTEFLKQQHLAESLTVKEVQILLDFMELVTYRKNGVIADIGEVGEALYFVVDGTIALTVEESGGENEIATVHAGDMLGEMSFFDRRPRSIRLRAKSDDTRLLRLTRTMYNRLRVEHPYITVTLLEQSIISLDHLFRHLTAEVSTYADYLFGKGKK